jgi:hypothetical protein
MRTGAGNGFNPPASGLPGLLNGDDAAPPRGIVILKKWNEHSVLWITVECMIYR